MPEIALYQPDIAQNVGTIVRTAVALGMPVHVMEPMGFVWDEPKMRRAGMDYLDRANITRHKSYTNFYEQVKAQGKRIVLLTTKGATPIQDFKFQANDVLLFGRESAGVPDDVHNQADARVVIPMVTGERSMNLAITCGITAYEALKQQNMLPK